MASVGSSDDRALFFLIRTPPRCARGGGWFQERDIGEIRQRMVECIKGLAGTGPPVLQTTDPVTSKATKTSNEMIKFVADSEGNGTARILTATAVALSTVALPSALSSSSASSSAASSTRPVRGQRGGCGRNRGGDMRGKRGGAAGGSRIHVILRALHAGLNLGRSKDSKASLTTAKATADRSSDNSAGSKRQRTNANEGVKTDEAAALSANTAAAAAASRDAQVADMLGSGEVDAFELLEEDSSDNDEDGNLDEYDDDNGEDNNDDAYQ